MDFSQKKKIVLNFFTRFAKYESWNRSTNQLSTRSTMWFIYSRWQIFIHLLTRILINEVILRPLQISDFRHKSIDRRRWQIILFKWINRFEYRIVHKCTRSWPEIGPERSNCLESVGCVYAGSSRLHIRYFQEDTKRFQHWCISMKFIISP